MGFFRNTVLAILSHVHLGAEVGSSVGPDHGPGLVPWVPSRFGGSLGITVGNYGPAMARYREPCSFCGSGMLKRAARPCSVTWGTDFLEIWRHLGAIAWAITHAPFWQSEAMFMWR